jgi:hypothetical protein
VKENKRKKLEHDIKEFIKNVLNLAEQQDKLDHMNIEISNHNGNLQMDYKLRDRKKVY